jgi:hypothetical protein
MSQKERLVNHWAGTERRNTIPFWLIDSVILELINKNLCGRTPKAREEERSVRIIFLALHYVKTMTWTQSVQIWRLADMSGVRMRSNKSGTH